MNTSGTNSEYRNRDAPRSREETMSETGHDPSCPCVLCLFCRGPRSIPEEVRAIYALTTKCDALRAALERLHNAAEVYAAVQSRATHPRIGLVQPITVADGNELNASLDSSRQALAGQPEIG